MIGIIIRHQDYTCSPFTRFPSSSNSPGFDNPLLSVTALTGALSSGGGDGGSGGGGRGGEGNEEGGEDITGVTTWC